MESTNSTAGNDYAVAKELNIQVKIMILLVPMANNFGLSENYELNDLNRAYILVVDELQRIYKRHPELWEIEPSPIWSRFDVLESFTWEINSYFENPDESETDAHIARVNRLCIISNVGTPTFTPEQTKLIDYSNTVIHEHVIKLVEARDQKKVDVENNWHIPEYTLAYRPDGTILINDVMKLKKTHAGSTTERLLEEALKNPDTLFKPDLGQTSRNLSTIFSSAGFTPTLRQLFFPIVSNSKGIIFRPIITREQVDSDGVDTTDLDLQLKALGADTKPGK